MRAGESRPGGWRLGAAGVLCAALAHGCGARGASDPSPAAAEIIAEASDQEERRGLEQARDDIDAGMRAAVQEKDAEIEKLRRENDALRARLKR